VHTHRRPSVLFILTGSDFVRRDPLGHVTLDTRQSSDVPKFKTPVWLEQLPPHTVENVGNAEINSAQVEIKSAA